MHGSDAVCLFEQMIKMRKVIEAEFVGNIEDGHIRFPQQIAGVFHLFAVEILHDGNAEMLLEFHGKRALAVARKPIEIAHFRRFVIDVFQLFHEGIQQFGQFVFLRFPRKISPRYVEEKGGDDKIFVFRIF